MHQRLIADLGRCMQEFQTELSKLQEFPWTVATGDDEKHLRALGKLPPKEPSRAEAFVNWCASSFKASPHVSISAGWGCADSLLWECPCMYFYRSTRQAARLDVLGAMFHC